MSNNFNRGRALKRRTKPDPRAREIRATHIRTGEQLHFRGLRACEEAGFVMANVSRCCRGERKEHGGYRWEYLPALTE